MSSDTTNESSGALPPAQQLNTIPPRKYPEKTGGLPPKFQLSSIPRRKSAELRGDPRPITPPPTAEQIAQTRDLVYEQRPFTDHTGNGALSLFRSLVKKDQKPLLPAWSWQIYITYGATSATCDSLPLAFYKTIIEQLSHNDMQWFRFDFLFLPNADNVTCIRHYRGEKLFRAGGDLALVLSYAVRSATWQARNIMVVMDRKDWEKEGVMWLEFDGEDEGEKEPEAEVPDGFYKERRRQRALEKPYVPGVDFVGHHMDETRRMCKIREAWEREYLLAKELMEM